MVEMSTRQAPRPLQPLSSTIVELEIGVAAALELEVGVKV